MNDTPTKPVTVKTVSVTVGRKINLGNYESATVGVTVWADIDPEADLNDAMHDLWVMAKENVRVQSAQYIKGVSVNIEEAMLGLPVKDDAEPLPF